MSTLKVGIVGCGHISTAHVKAWRKAADCTVAMAFDLDTEMAKKRAAALNIPHVPASLDELIAGCDVVDICTPPKSHAALALKALEAGKHVLIEKPVVVEEADWDRLREAIDRTGAATKLGVIHNIKVSGAIQAARKLVDEGRIGEIIRLERQFLTNPKHDRMLTDQPHWSHHLPGGRWFETLPHELYLMHYFVGPSELMGVAANRTPRATSAVRADEVTLTFKNEGCISVIHYSSNCLTNRRNLVLIGTKGEIYVDILADTCTVTTLEDSQLRRAVGLEYMNALARLSSAVPDRARYVVGRLRGLTPHARVIMQFAEHIRGRAESPTPLDEVDFTIRNGYRVGRAIDAAAAAAIGGAPASAQPA